MRITGFLPAVALVALACDSTTNSSPADIDVASDVFTPSLYTVPATDMVVTWRWSSGRHNVTFETGGVASGDYTLGVFERDFGPLAAGTYRYRCTIHSSSFTVGMVGSIVKP